MKYNKEEIKEKAIQLYGEGKTLTDVSRELGASRKYITDLIKDDPRFQELKNKRIVNVYKRKDINEKRVSIPPEYWDKIGVSKDHKVKEQVEISVDKDKKIIKIKKL